jgi:hypothetical protein
VSDVDRYEWERLVRRVRLGAPTKSVAAHLAQYADRDGTRVRPGVARLVAVTELSERSVHAALKKLRHFGLIEQVNKGGRAGDGRAYATVYRLTIPANVLSLPGVLGPDEETALDPQDVQVETSSQPAPGASQPAPGASQPAPGAPHQPLNPTTYQPLLTSVGNSPPREDGNATSNVIQFGRGAR